MKIIVTIKLILVFIICTSFIQNEKISNDVIKKEFSTVQKVYICGGKYAQKYHSKSTCKGLNNCKSNVYSLSSTQVAKSKGYSACQLCW